MNKKSLTIIISIICFILFATVVVASLIKNGVISTENLYTTLSSDEQLNNDDKQKNDNKKNGLEYPLFKVLLSEGIEFPVQYSDETHKENEYSDIFVKYDNINISKERGNFDLCGDFKETKDENGNITNEYSYITADVTITNKGKNVFTTSLNNMFLSIGPESYSELRSYNSQLTSRNKDYYIIDFEPNVEYKYTLAFIAEDALIEKYRNELYLFVSFYNNSYRDGEEENIPLIKKNNGE